MLEIRGIQRGSSTWQCLGEQLMPPPKPFTVTIIFLGGLLMERRENTSGTNWDGRVGSGWWGSSSLPESPAGLCFPHLHRLGVSTPSLQLPCRGGNEAGSVCLENDTDLRRFPLLQLSPSRGAWKTLLFIVRSASAQRDIPQQTSHQSGGGMLSSSLAPRCPVPSSREVGNHTGAPPSPLIPFCPFWWDEMLTPCCGAERQARRQSKFSAQIMSFNGGEEPQKMKA